MQVHVGLTRVAAGCPDDSPPVPRSTLPGKAYDSLTVLVALTATTLISVSDLASWGSRMSSEKPPTPDACVSAEAIVVSPDITDTTTRSPGSKPTPSTESSPPASDRA